jgi:hypothetical protein
MTLHPILIVAFAACVVTNGVAAALPGDDAEAIISELRGSATLEASGKPRRAVQLYDWLAEGTTITVGKRSTVVIVLASGARFELHEKARVTILPANLPAAALVTTLPSFPPLPVVPPVATRAGIAGATRASTGRSAGVRIRGSSIQHLYPAGDATIADETTLRFDAPKGATAYLVTIEDEQGSRIFEIKTDRTDVAVPPGVLGPGRGYYWRVAVAGDLTRSSAGAAFATLLASTTEARRALIARVRRDDAHDLALIGRIDERLGLLIEARDELGTAATRAPGDQRLRQLVGSIESRLVSR